MTVIETEVLVVGGGPAGLSMAALLGGYGVNCVLVERRAGVNPHPRARSVNVRTAEIFRQLGILDRIAAVSLPRPWTEQLVYTESLAGREIGRTPMAVQPIVGGRAVSPAPWLLSSQDQIEPIIRAVADAADTVDVRFATALADLEVGESGATARLKATGTAERAGGSDAIVRARFVVAADGAGSMIRRHLGIAMEGPTELATMVNCHFYADLDPWTASRPAALYWTTHPARNVFQKIDTEHRWLCQIGYDPRTHKPEDFTAERAGEWIRTSIGDRDVAIEILDVIPWVMSSTVATQFRHESVFLIGDAAHQLPPSGGFGMNTAVQDAHNLAWKIAFVLQGRAGRELLDTYHAERAPIARYNADRSLENTRNVGRIRKQVEQGSDPASVAEAVAAAGRYGNWLGMDLGLHYETGCLLPDGSDPPHRDDPVADYVDCARPGHRAPHFDLDDGRSSIDLYDRQLTVVVGSELAELPAYLAAGPDLRLHRLAGRNASQIQRLHGIGGTGAMLVRPDGHVAWRQESAVDADVISAAIAELGLSPRP